MIRKRDFILFVTALLFLLVGISSTVFGEVLKNTSSVSATVLNWDNDRNEENIWNAESLDDSIDRESFIERMKGKLRNVDPNIPEPVFSSVDQNSVVDVETFTNCFAHNIVLPKEHSWPSEVSLSLIEGVLLVQDIDNRTLLQIPQRSVRNSRDVCLAGDVIGVAMNGNLLKNSESQKYKLINSNVLIGYALDGFPIYTGEAENVELDSCGGYSSLEGYRYQIKTDSSQIIRCYAGMPVSLIE